MSDSIALRVYYEDTDFSGRVYHASYLRFMERGRTEWLRARGFGQKQLASAAGLGFAVRDLKIEYLAPAEMDDLLNVETAYRGTLGALLQFEQRVLCGERVLASARVGVVAIRGARPVRPPREFLAAVEDPPASR